MPNTSLCISRSPWLLDDKILYSEVTLVSSWFHLPNIFLLIVASPNVLACIKNSPFPKAPKEIIKKVNTQIKKASLTKSMSPCTRSLPSGGRGVRAVVGGKKMGSHHPTRVSSALLNTAVWKYTSWYLEIVKILVVVLIQTIKSFPNLYWW